jgi:hypothetical protein
LVTDKQVRRLFALAKVEGGLETAAAKAGMDAKTAPKYRRLGRVPSELAPGSRWRTREDSFQEVWEEVQSLLEVNPGSEAKTIFEYLQRRDAGRFPDGQLRTLQRRVKVWRATDGPVKEVFFAHKQTTIPCGTEIPSIDTGRFTCDHCGREYLVIDDVSVIEDQPTSKKKTPRVQ